jgi:hypothetical protein
MELDRYQTRHEIAVKVAHPFLRFKPAIYIAEGAWSDAAKWILIFFAGLGVEELSLGLIRSTVRKLPVRRIAKAGPKLKQRFKL